MSNRRDRQILLRYTYLVLLEIYFTGVDSTICTDRADIDGFTNVLPMCRSETLTADRVVVDTYDTGVLGYDSCHCTVRLAQAHADGAGVQFSAYPNTTPTAGCGSILRFYRLPGNTYIEYGCQQITGNIISNFVVNELLNITLSKANNTIQWTSGYCIFIQSNVNLNIVCNTILTPSTTDETTRRTTTPTALPSNPRSTATIAMSTSTTNVTCGICKCNAPELSVVTVIVPIVVSILVVTVGTVVNILLYKRRVALVNKPKSSTSGMTTPGTVHYDSLDLSRVELRNTYEEISTRQTYVNMAMETK